MRTPYPRIPRTRRSRRRRFTQPSYRFPKPSDFPSGNDTPPGDHGGNSGTAPSYPTAAQQQQHSGGTSFDNPNPNIVYSTPGGHGAVTQPYAPTRPQVNFVPPPVFAADALLGGSKLPSLLSTLLNPKQHTAQNAKLHDTLDSVMAKVNQIPATFEGKGGDLRVTKFKGEPVLGTPSLASVRAAYRKGTLGRTGGNAHAVTVALKSHEAPPAGAYGQLTTPRTRAARTALISTTKAARAAARPDLSGLTPEQKAVYPYVNEAHKQYPDIPKSVLYALTNQESGFNPLAVSSADAHGLTQFIPGTAASYGVQTGDSPAAQMSQEVGAAHLLHDKNFASDPQGALSAYSGGYAAGDYNNPILQAAQTTFAGLDKKTMIPPKLAASKAQAEQAAKRLNISLPEGLVHAAAGEEPAPNQPQTVMVRQDGAAMVKWADAVLGTPEGSALANKWAVESGLPDSVGGDHPWCAAFIAAGLRRRGIEPPSNGALVSNYMPDAWGNGAKIVTTPKPGDLILYGGEHIALYIGNGQAIGGNQSDNVTQVPVESGATFVRPPYSGKKVAVAAGDPFNAPGGSGVSAQASALIAAGAPAGAVSGAVAATKADPFVPLVPLTAPSFAAQAPLPYGYTPPPQPGAPQNPAADSGKQMLALLASMYPTASATTTLTGRRRR